MAENDVNTCFFLFLCIKPYSCDDFPVNLNIYIMVAYRTIQTVEFVHFGSTREIGDSLFNKELLLLIGVPKGSSLQLLYQILHTPLLLGSLVS